MNVMPTRKNTFSQNAPFLKTFLLTFIGVFLCMSCGTNADAGQTQSEEVTSFVEGQITLSTEIDTLADYSGFEVLVAKTLDDRVDTLAFAETNIEGFFSMDVVAPRADIYTLVIGRSGSILKIDEIVIAQDDSARIQMKFPFGNRPVMVRSRENAALLGYKNTMTLYDRDMKKFAVSGNATNDDFAALVDQTTELLWNLKESNPETIAARLSAVQSILLLEGWNDSLIVARTKLLEQEGEVFGAVVGSARRAQVRVGGPESAVILMEELKEGVQNPDNLVVLQSELVLALRDAGDMDQALDAARMLKMEYATDTTWIEWADKAIYDLEKLAPGMPAPPFQAIDIDGEPVSLDSFKGKHLLLEFYAPGTRFEQDLYLRNQAYELAGEGEGFELLSLSLQPDSLLNEAFFEGRDIPGRHVFLPDGGDAEILDAYNVVVLPTRFLIDPEGKIVGKYVLGNGILAFKEAQSRSVTPNN